MDELDGTFTVIEYAVDGDSDDEITRITGDLDDPELYYIEMDWDDVDACARAIAAQWTPHHVATAAWSVTLTVVDVDEVTVWDPATERRRATVSLPTRAELAPKIRALVDDLDRLLDPYGRSLDELDPEFRILIYGAEVFRVAAYAFDTAGTDVYRHNLDAMASSARHAAELADEIGTTVRRRS